MITAIDRMFLVTFFRSYAIVLVSLISLFVVIDLFTHLDDFVNKPGGFAASVRHITVYYGNRVPELFDLLGNFMTLIAGAFTVAWMQRNNELLPLLSAGVPTRRAVRPVLLGSALTLALAPLNQQFVIPEVADQLTMQRDDPDRAKAQVLMGAYDASGIHFEGFAGYKKDRRVDRMCVTFPENSPSGMLHLTAEEAVFIPKNGDDPLTGGWLLTRTAPESFEGKLPTNLTVLGTSRFFIKVQDADYDTVCRGGAWYVYASTTDLREMLIDPEPRRRGKMAVLFHTRVTRPFVGMLMVVFGLSVILWNPNRHVIISSGLCLLISGGLFLFVIACKYLGDQDVLPAALAAWLPVIVFGPPALVAFDSVHT
ncbi:LptF/LptG family permease [Gemmata sp. G18]|uniref:LptF/LptG family permease n=1 Tax=Gemmata palustris TaxID=2822762 RepID=A0ABS5BR07_9BACT|nr:LptF/LptG family permease [Gemmata palustris]MBP3955872.1 LptF/LptG family permease [Gemmata palustris]